MFELSPFEETLYLDVDTVVLDRLDFGFDMAKRHGIACAFSDCPWARRSADLADKGDLPTYDTGAIFFTRAAAPIFRSWQERVKTVNAAYRTQVGNNLVMQVPVKDDAAFALAMAEAERPPFVLPMNWNFRPRTQRTWWGPIKIWHDRADVPASLVSVTQEQAKEESIIRYLKFNA